MENKGLDDFAHVQDDLNLHILCMFEGTFSIYMAQFNLFAMCFYNLAQYSRILWKDEYISCSSSDFPSNQSFSMHAQPLSKTMSSSLAQVAPWPTA